MNYSGDPVIILEISSAKGKIKKVVLHFSQKNLPDSIKERSLWASEINKILRSVFRVSPAPVLKKPPVTKVFCITCGTKFTDGSESLYQVWEKIIYPDQPLPSHQIDTSGIKRVKITEIPIENIDMPQKERSIPNINNLYEEENIPFNTQLHNEHDERKSFFTRSRKRKPE